MEALENERQTRVFLSYARSDLRSAEWVRKQLLACGVEVFRDVDHTRPGDAWWEQLADLVTRSDAVVFLLSPRSAASEVCAREIAFAAELNKRVFPAAVEPVDWAVVPMGLSTLHAVTLYDDETRDTQVRQLASALLVDHVWVREHTRLQDRARQWLATGRNTSELLIGEPLADAEYWLLAQSRTAPAPTKLQQEFIQSSRDLARETREKQVSEAELQRQQVEAQRDRVQRNLVAASSSVNLLAHEIAWEFRFAPGAPEDFIRDILSTTEALATDLLGNAAPLLQVAYNAIGSLSVLADARIALNDFDSALQTADHVQGIAEKAAESAPGSPLSLICLAEAGIIAGDLQLARGNLTAAEYCYCRGLSFLSDVTGELSATMPAKRAIAILKGRTAEVKLRAGKPLESLQTFIEAEPVLAENLRDDGNWNLHFRDWQKLALAKGETLATLSRWDAAISCLEQVSDACSAHLGKFPQDRFVALGKSACLEKIGEIYEAMARPFDACDAYYDACHAINGLLVARPVDDGQPANDPGSTALEAHRLRCYEKLGRALQKEPNLHVYLESKSFATTNLEMRLMRATGKPIDSASEYIRSPEYAIGHAEKFLKIRAGADTVGRSIVLEHLKEDCTKVRREWQAGSELSKRALAWLEAEIKRLE